MCWYKQVLFTAVKITRYITFVLLSFIPSLTWAARPFVTDDARLTNSGKCQLESWTRQYKSSMEFWALPACNPSGNLELTVGGGYLKNDDIQGSTHDYIIQAKTLFKTLEPNQFGYGFAVGKIAHPEINPGPNQFGNTYLYFPVSYEFNNHLVIHSNLGLLKENGDKTIKSSFGLGTEMLLKTNRLGIAEIYGDGKQKPFSRLDFVTALYLSYFK